MPKCSRLAAELSEQRCPEPRVIAPSASYPFSSTFSVAATLNRPTRCGWLARILVQSYGEDTLAERQRRFPPAPGRTQGAEERGFHRPPGGRPAGREWGNGRGHQRGGRAPRSGDPRAPSGQQRGRQGRKNQRAG